MSLSPARVPPWWDAPLRELPTRDHLLVACISHKGSILIPGGDDAIQPGDSVIIVTTHTGLSDLSDILA